jgi:hypothetical protein
LNPLIHFELILMKAFAASDAVEASCVYESPCNPRASYLKPKEMQTGHEISSCTGL